MSPLIGLAEPLALRERLAAAFATGRTRPAEVAAGLLAGGRKAVARTGPPAAGAGPALREQAREEERSVEPAARIRSAPAHGFALRAGCLTKLFTATLARRACASGRLALDAEVGPMLAPQDKALAGITLRHLLEHTHGLDDSLLDAAPLGVDGRIDAAKLVAAVTAASPLSGPGELYSYSNAGAWLAAALLERSAGEPYARLLHELLEPLGGALGASGPRGTAPAQGKAVCPAMGGELTVGIAGMLEFLRLHAPGAAPIARAADVSPSITALPGWHALERGVHVGWKYHGAGWFGHQSVWPRASALVRVQPAAGLALVVASTELPAALAAAKLFGAYLPEFATLEIPRPLSKERAAGLDLRRYEGLYRSAGRAVLIAPQEDGSLALRACRLRADGAPREPAVGATLRACEGHLFFTDPPLADAFPYVQFLSSCAGGFGHLWNGRFVLRKVSCRRD